MPTKRKSAYTAALREAQQQSETLAPSHSETVEPSKGEAATQLDREAGELHYGETSERLYSSTVTQQHSTTVKSKKEEKISFYLTHEQANKLDDLAHEHRKRTGKRVNRNDIVRHLIDRCDIADLQGI